MLIPVQGIFEVDANILTILATPHRRQFIAIKPARAANITRGIGSKQNFNVGGVANTTSSESGARRLQLKYSQTTPLYKNLLASKNAQNVTSYNINFPFGEQNGTFRVRFISV